MKTLVLGASTNPIRYSYKAIQMLSEYNHEIAALGIKEGVVADIPITNKREKFANIHTVTLYLNPYNQEEYYDYIISLQPKRVIFNPGTENRELQNILLSKNIEYQEACTLVMLRSGQF